MSSPAAFLPLLAWLLPVAWGPVQPRAGASLVINEFLPDPAGADAGREFVEILNSGPQAIDMVGVGLEFGNGSQPDSWVGRWRCDTPMVLPPGQRLVLVDRNWMGPDSALQVEVYLGLQNGPDAIRLVRDGTVLDLVGYGALTDTLMMEGSPVGVSPGLSLSRRPDGRDTQDNGRDFVAADPTPGAPNFHPHALSLLGITLEPPALDRPLEPVVLAVHLRNTGTLELPAGMGLVQGPQYPLEAMLDLGPSDAEVWVRFHWQPRTEGLIPLTFLFPVPGEQDTLRVPLGHYQVGPAELVLNEAMPAPAQGQGEWLEVEATGAGPVYLGDFGLRDEDGDWVALPSRNLVPGQLLVLAQDPGAMLEWHQANRDAGAVGPCAQLDLAACLDQPAGAWPTLNNSAPEGREFADRLWLGRRLPGEEAWTVVDQVVLGGVDASLQDGDGRSWERLARRPSSPGLANWSFSTAAAGSTPGCRNSLTAGAVAPGELTLEPEVLGGRQGVTTQHIAFQVPPGVQGWTLAIHDTWGHRVRDLGGDMAGPGPRQLHWDGRDENGNPVAAGAYVVLLVLLGPQGETLNRSQALSAVHREGP